MAKDHPPRRELCKHEKQICKSFTIGQDSDGDFKEFLRRLGEELQKSIQFQEGEDSLD